MIVIYELSIKYFAQIEIIGTQRQSTEDHITESYIDLRPTRIIETVSRPFIGPTYLHSIAHKWSVVGLGNFYHDDFNSTSINQAYIRSNEIPLPNNQNYCFEMILRPTGIGVNEDSVGFEINLKLRDYAGVTDPAPVQVHVQIKVSILNESSAKKFSICKQ